jgi:hypothetical protein
MLVVMCVGPFSGLFATREDSIDTSRGSESQCSVDQHGLCKIVGDGYINTKASDGIHNECPIDCSGWR